MSDGMFDLLYVLNETLSIVVKIGIIALLWVLVPKLRIRSMILKEYIDCQKGSR